MQNPNEALVAIVEGKFHQVKKTFKARAKNVKYLKHISFAGLNFDSSLKPSAFRELISDKLSVVMQLC